MAVLTRPPALLEQAVSYTLGTATLATPRMLRRATPCAGWDLRTLVVHVSDSLGVLTEAMSSGVIGAGPAPGAEPGAGADPLACLRRRARALLSACAAAEAREHLVGIGDRELTASVVAAAGAIEIAVHGWDISAACGVRVPIPAGLAAALLPVAHPLIPPHARAGLFAGPVPVPALACPGDRLVAFLGRQPRLPVTPGTG